MAKLLLKVSKKGDKGYRIASVPFRKLSRMAGGGQKFWKLEGEFLVLSCS